MTVALTGDATGTESNPGGAVAPPLNAAHSACDPVDRDSPVERRIGRTAGRLSWRVTPSTRVLWRGPDKLQLELGPRAVVISGPAAHVVAGLPADLRPGDQDGRAGPPGALGHNTSTESVLTELRRAGFLTGGESRRETVGDPRGGETVDPRGGETVDDPGGGETLDGRSTIGRTIGGPHHGVPQDGGETDVRSEPRTGTPPLPIATRDTSAVAALLAPDLAALSARFGGRAAEVMAARRDQRVGIHGNGRLPTLVASLFAAAGIGHVHVTQADEVALRDAIPGGLRPADEGRRPAAAAHEAIRRVAPGVDTTAVQWPAGDLTVLVAHNPIREAVHRALLAGGRTHLAAGVWGAHAVVGPLVVPGYTSCLGCADLHRRDRDPVWPALAAQLATSPPGWAPSEVAVCVFAAAVTVLQGLAYLDGEQPATADGTLEMLWPDWRLRRRTWRPHPDCSCTGLAGPRHTGRCD